MKLPKLITGLAVVAGLAVPVSGDAQAGGMGVSAYGGYGWNSFLGLGLFGISSLAGNFVADADDEGFFGTSVSVPVDPGNLLFGNIEPFFEGEVTERDKGSETSVNSGTIPSVDGSVSSFSGPTDLEAYLERERYEFGVNLTLPARPGGLLPLDLVVTPFGGFANEDVQSRVTQGADYFQTDSDVDWWYGGVLVGAEHVMPLGGGFDLVVGGAGGIYAYDADGDFDTTSNLTGPVNARDTDSNVGFRARASVALRTMLGEGVQVSIFGGLDYWSHVPYSKLPDPSVLALQSPAHIATDDVLTLRGGVKLTLFLDDLM